MSAAAESHEWLLEAEAAEYCRCSPRSFRRMALPANDSGGRKVYSRQSLDLALAGRAWQRSTNAADWKYTNNTSQPEIALIKPAAPNSARGSFSLVAGTNCHAKHDRSILIGDGLVSGADHEVQFGTADEHVTLHLSAEDAEIVRKALIHAFSAIR